MPKALVSSPISAYENTVEVESVAALEEIISDPDSMRMQALLVRERILGPAHPDTSYYIRYRYDRHMDGVGPLLYSVDGLAVSLAYPRGRRGVISSFIVQMIFTCLAYGTRRGKGRGSAPCGMNGTKAN
jgi:hypothetical protein